MTPELRVIAHSLNDTVADLLRATGVRHLEALRPELDRADPHSLVSQPARLLCCGLAALAETAAAARGVTHQVEACGRAAARLALLTKLDDEVIDAAEFHGGPGTPRRTRKPDRY